MTTLVDIPYGPFVDTEALAAGVGKYKAGSIDAAAERLTAARAKLTRRDGSPFFGPQEHQEREAALLATFDADVQRIADEAARDIVSAEKTFALLAGADPLDRLSVSERADAASLKAFIDEDVTTLSPDELTTRITAIVAAGDRVRAVLYHRALHRRVRENTARMIDQGGRLSTRDGARYERDRALLETLAPLVADPTADATRADAVTDITRAKALQGHIRRTRGQFDGSAVAYEAELRRRFRM